MSAPHSDQDRAASDDIDADDPYKTSRLLDDDQVGGWNDPPHFPLYGPPIDSSTKNKLTKGSQLVGGIVFPAAKLTEAISSEGSQWSQGAHTVLGALPGWVLFHGLFQMYESYLLAKEINAKNPPDPYEFETKNYSSRAKAFKVLVRSFSGLYLTIQAIKVLDGSISGAEAQPALFLSLAINSGIDFVFALDKLRRVLSNKNSLTQEDDYGDEDRGSSYSPVGTPKEIFDAFADVFIKGFACGGWTLLALGHPTGWYFLAASAACHVLKFAIPRVSCFKGCLFPPITSTPPGSTMGLGHGRNGGEEDRRRSKSSPNIT